MSRVKQSAMSVNQSLSLNHILSAQLQAHHQRLPTSPARLFVYLFCWTVYYAAYPLLFFFVLFYACNCKFLILLFYIGLNILWNVFAIQILK
jgi:hypothetical protein